MRIEVYDPNCTISIFVDIAAVISAILLIRTLFCLFRNQIKTETLARILAFWAIVPPVWFWVEYHLIYRNCAVVGTLDEFKYGQQVSIAIWAGVVFCIAALLNSKQSKG